MRKNFIIRTWFSNKEIFAKRQEFIHPKNGYCVTIVHHTVCWNLVRLTFFLLLMPSENELICLVKNLRLKGCRLRFPFTVSHFSTFCFNPNCSTIGKPIFWNLIHRKVSFFRISLIQAMLQKNQQNKKERQYITDGKSLRSLKIWNPKVPWDRIFSQAGNELGTSF